MSAPASPAPEPAHRVMVSSTFTDLIAHRDDLKKALLNHGLHPEVMEHSGAKPAGDVIDASLNMVRKSAAYILIVSHKYGQTPACPERNPKKVSITELEFDEAQKLVRPTLVFVMHEDYPVPPKHMELDAEKREKLAAFRTRAKLALPGGSVNRVYAVFNSLEEFNKAISAPISDLSKLLEPSPPTTQHNAAQPSLTPQPPEFYAARGDYIGSHDFVGRTAQLKVLDDWALATDPDTVLLFEAIGGNGKSMLTWHWVKNHATTARKDWAGRFWYSFYEKGAVMTDFCREALAYMTGAPVKTLEQRPIAEVKKELLALLHARPWLLILDGLERVLVAYHRIDAAEMADEEMDFPTDKVLDRNPCDAIRDEDNELLRALAGCAPSKILISSRLIPRVLLNPSGLPIQHVQPLNLPGLDEADAEALLRANGVSGDSSAIRYYLKTYCENHPLTIGALAGLISNYLPEPGDFDRWAADPQHGAALDLARLDLKQRRNHILTAAIAALSAPGCSLLSTLALIQEGVDYETLAAFNPHPPVEAHLLGETVRDLRQRGLLQYDSPSKRYDLHPVVRGVASGALKGPDKETHGQKVIDFFNARPHSPYEQAQTMEDVASGLHVVRTLLKLERWRQAADAYRGDLSHALLFNLEAYVETLALVRPFFPAGWGTLAETVSARNASRLASYAAVALYSLGENEGASRAYEASLKGDLAVEDWFNAMVSLRSISCNLLDQNRLAPMLRVQHLCLDLATACEGEKDIFMSRLNLYDAQNQVGQWQEAEANWQTLSGMRRPSSRASYRQGDAERYFALAQFWQGRLEEAHLNACATLAEKDNNRIVLRYLHRLRGDWQRQRGEYALAATSYQEALRMARERRLTSTSSETALALCKYHLGQLPEPQAEAQRLANQGHSSQLLAEIYEALGDTAQAQHHALAAYKRAWADGEPYVNRYDLTQATALLTRLGEPIPDLPAYDATKDKPFPWEAEIREIIERIKKEKAEEREKKA